MTDGIILIDKPAQMTSFGVVARIRRVLSKQVGKKVKVGHTGTLDPFATGLMILVVGKECKNAAQYTKLDKVYRAVFKLGQTSTTGDPEGELTVVSTVQPIRQEIEQACQSFIGKSWQRPPIFSALKVNGRRSYQLARDHQAIELPKRLIEIYSLTVIDYSYPYVTIQVHVSSGTYIRSLVADIGAKLGTGAYCRELRRLSIANWSVGDARSLVDFGITS